MKKELKFKDEFFDLICEGRKTQTRRPIKPQPKGIDGFRKGLVNEAWQAGFVDLSAHMDWRELYFQLKKIIKKYSWLLKR